MKMASKIAHISHSYCGNDITLIDGNSAFDYNKIELIDKE